MKIHIPGQDIWWQGNFCRGAAIEICFLIKYRWDFWAIFKRSLEQWSFSLTSGYIFQAKESVLYIYGHPLGNAPKPN